MPCRIALAFALMVGLMVPGVASAQSSAALTSGGMDLHLFRPAIDSKGHFSVNGTEVMGNNHYNFGLVVDGGFGILPFNGYVNDDSVLAADAERTDRMVDYAFMGTLMFNWGFLDQLVVGIQLPIGFTGGPNVEVPGYYNDDGSPSSLDYNGIGDLTLHAKWRIFSSARDVAGLAAIMRFEFPTGDSSSFTGENGMAFWPSVVGEVEPHEKIRLSAEVGYRVGVGNRARFQYDGRTEPDPGGTSATNAVLDANEGNEIRYGGLLTYGLGVSFGVTHTLDLVGELYGTYLGGYSSSEGGVSMEALGGLKFYVQENSYMMLGFGGRIPHQGFQAADYRATLGIVFEPSIGDRDGDGILDDVDECPDDPEDMDGFEDEDGCPEDDNDGDGIIDLLDECPLVPEDFDGDDDDDGCPEGHEGDRDGDGIPDHLDECPDDPEDIDGFQDEDGCPDPDNDQDGILDVNDMCPDDPEDYDGFEDEDGCPDPDNDADRILDEDDQCPMDPETYNGLEDEDGCPDRGSVVIEDNSIIILEKIYFATDSAVILRRSFPIIDAVAATLAGNPQIALVEIQGHADERGSDDYNLHLTRDRAASVVEALVQRGVTRERLRSAGYGEFCPVDSASNQTAWERNRRVEFKIIETEDGPTGVQVACPAGRHLVPN